MYRQFRRFDKGEFVVVFVDTASGGLDNTSATFLSKTRRDIPLTFHSRVTTSDFISQLIPVLERIYDVTGVRPVIAFERNNGGAFLMDQVASMNKLGKYTIFKMPTYGREDPPDSVKYGWDTNSATRPKMLQDWKEAVDKRLITMYDADTVNEHFSFVVVKTSSNWRAQAESGAHDDRVMSCAGAWQLYQLCEAPKKATHMILDLPEEQLFEGGFY